MKGCPENKDERIISFHFYKLPKCLFPLPGSAVSESEAKMAFIAFYSSWKIQYFFWSKSITGAKVDVFKIVDFKRMLFLKNSPINVETNKQVWLL